MKYRKKPVVIEAVQWTGNNIAEVAEFMDTCKAFHINSSSKSIIIETLEGAMTASKEDYIIKGVQGEFYPCKPDIFTSTYEKVEEV